MAHSFLEPAQYGKGPLHGGNTAAIPMRRVHSLCLAVALLGLAGCSTATPPSGSAATAAQMQKLIGNASCSDDSQCRTLAWGSKICGGPQRWVAWSTEGTDRAALVRLAQQHAAQQRAEQQRSGMASNCAYLGDPGARCVSNRCVLREPAPMAQ